MKFSVSVMQDTTVKLPLLMVDPSGHVIQNFFVFLMSPDVLITHKWCDLTHCRVRVVCIGDD